MFHFLLYVAKGSSRLNFREKRTILNRISNLARINLTHTHAWSTVESLPSNRLLLIPVHGSGPLSSSTANNPHPVPIVMHHNLTFNINQLPISKREWDKVHLPGRLVTRLAAYHIYGMWLVLSNA